MFFAELTAAATAPSSARRLVVAYEHALLAWQAACLRKRRNAGRNGSGACVTG